MYYRNEPELAILESKFFGIPKQYGEKEIVLSILGINSKVVSDVICKLLYETGIRKYLSGLRVTRGKLKKRWNFIEEGDTVAKMKIDNRILSHITMSVVMLACATLAFLGESCVILYVHLLVCITCLHGLTTTVLNILKLRLKKVSNGSVMIIVKTFHTD